MEHIINAKNTTVTDALRSYIETRFAKFAKYTQEDIKVYTKLEVKDGGLRHKVEVTIPFGKQTVRAEISDTDMYAAIDRAEKTVVRLLKKRKEIIIQRKQAAVKPTELTEDENLLYSITRTKEHKLRSMTSQEACENMEMIGHPFYVYKDIDNHDKTCVVYLKENGTYGKLIFAEE